MRTTLKLAMLLAVAPWPSLAATDSAIAACRAMKEASARLACYDALPLAGTPAPAAAAAPDPTRFGLPRRQAGQELESIQSYIPGKFEGWKAGMRIRLANGQVWQIADGSERFEDMQDPKVSIRRGALGSFYLDIEGENRSPLVRRIQ